MRRMSQQDLLSYFNALPESLATAGEAFKEIIPEDLSPIYVGAYARLQGELQRFIETAGTVAAQVNARTVTQQEQGVQQPGQQPQAARLGAVSGEEEREDFYDKKLKSKEKVKPGDSITTMPLLDRSKSVGSVIPPEFLAEECVRCSLGAGVRNINGAYPDVATAFKELVKRDKNLSKTQIDKVKAILASQGYTV